MGFFGNVSYQLAKCFDTLSFKNVIPSPYTQTTTEENIRYQNLASTGDQFIAETEKDEIGIRTGDKWLNCKKYQTRNPDNSWTTAGLTFFHTIPNPSTWTDSATSTSILNKVGGIDVISSGAANYPARAETDTESIQLGFGDFITLYKPVFDNAGHVENTDIQKYYLPTSPNLQTLDEVSRLIYHLGGYTPLIDLIKIFLYLTFKNDQNRQIVNWVKEHIKIDDQSPTDALLATSEWLVENLSDETIASLPPYSIEELCEHVAALENIDLSSSTDNQGQDSGDSGTTANTTNLYTYLDRFQRDITNLQNLNTEYLEMQKATPYVGYVLDFYNYITKIKTTIGYDWLKNTFVLQDIYNNSLNTFHFIKSEGSNDYASGTDVAVLLTNNTLLSTANNSDTTVFVNESHKNIFQSAYGQFSILEEPAPIILPVYNINDQKRLGIYQSTGGNNSTFIYTENNIDYLPVDIYIFIKIKLTGSSIYRRFKLAKQSI